MLIPESKLGFYPLVRALGKEVGVTPYGAQKLVKAVLHLWCQKEFVHLAERTPYGVVALLQNNRVRTFTEWLTTQPFNDAAFWLASAYATWVGDKARSDQALYFTPPKLADRVIDNLVARGASLTNHHWHDPACGGAAFLVPIAKRMAIELKRAGLPSIAILKKIEKQISGTDLNETLLGISTQFLLMALSEHIVASGFTPTFSLSKGDGLLDDKGGGQKVDVVACNPPYRKLDAAETKKYAASFGAVIRNQPNIYGLFIRKTMDMVSSGGLIGLLTPTSFLSGSSFSKLRSSIVQNSDVLQIDMLSKRSSMFIAVEQEAAIMVLQSKLSTGRVATAVDLRRENLAEICVLSPNGSYHHVGKCKLSVNGMPWPIPRSESDAALLLASQKWSCRLCDYGYFPKVGHLVAYRDERRRFVKRPKHKDSSYIVPIVWAGDITRTGFEHGRDHKLDRTDYFVEVSDPYHASVIRAPSVILQRVTSSDQAHRLIACAVPSKWQATEGGFVAENHVIALVATDMSTWSPQIMADLVNSEVINRLYRAISGATNVAVGEINELPLPDPAALKSALKKNSDINIAVRIAFGLPK
jgi:adenine-specific DNA-methyltransferase